MDAFAWPEIITDSDAGLQVDDAQVRRHLPQHFQRIAPDPVKFDRFSDRPIDALSQVHIALCAFHVGLVDSRITRVRQHLVNAAPGHYVTTKEQCDRLVSNRRWVSGVFEFGHDLNGSRGRHCQQRAAGGSKKVATVQSPRAYLRVRA